MSKSSDEAENYVYTYSVSEKLNIEQHENIDNLIVARWKTFMSQGHFRFEQLFSTLVKPLST